MTKKIAFCFLLYEHIKHNSIWENFFLEDEEFIKSKKIKNMELYNIFKKNINNIDFDESILETTKNNITTKKDLQYFLNSVELLNRITTNEQSDKYYKTNQTCFR